MQFYNESVKKNIFNKYSLPFKLYTSAIIYEICLTFNM